MRNCLLWGARCLRRRRLMDRVAALEERVAALEAGRPRIVQVGGGTQ